MSQSAKTSASVAPWRNPFLSNISTMDSPEFVLSTVHPADNPNAPLPRARYCVFRGFWTELLVNKHNKAPLNDRVYSSDLPTFTTDVRMAKIPELFASSEGHGDVYQSQGSGGGGPVEAVFWAEKVMVQWRFRGKAFIVGTDIEDSGSGTSGSRTVKHEVGERMRVLDEEKKSYWSWNTELTAQFGNLSPLMRGSFKRSGVPGTVMPKYEQSALCEPVSDLHDEVARSNFRVVIIVPEEVEQLDLSVPDKAQRWRFTYVGPDGDNGEEWKKEELWP